MRLNHRLETIVCRALKTLWPRWHLTNGFSEAALLQIVVLVIVAATRHIIRDAIQIDQLTLFIALRHLNPILSQQVLQSLYPGNVRTIPIGPLLVNPVQFTLQVYDGLVPLVQSRRQPNHNVPLLQQQMLIPLHVHFVVLKLLTLTLKLVQLMLVLLPDSALLLL